MSQDNFHAVDLDDPCVPIELAIQRHQSLSSLSVDEYGRGPNAHNDARKPIGEAVITAQRISSHRVHVDARQSTRQVARELDRANDRV